jgi:hypothetical protein
MPPPRCVSAPHAYRLRAFVGLANEHYFRLAALRRRLERRLSASIPEEALLDYLVGRSLDRIEDWERHRPASPLRPR